MVDLTLEDFLERLDGVRRMSPGKFAARCPSHDDRIGSMVITDAGDRMLLHCHAGCTVAQIMECRGLDQRDLFYEPRGGLERPDGRVSIAKVDPAPVPSSGARPAGGTASAPRPIGIAEHVVEAWQRMLTPELRERLLEVKGWGERGLSTCRVGWDTTRLTFPVYDPSGAFVVALVRYLPGGEPKSYAAGPRELWPAPESLPDGDVWLVEGEPDRVSAVELGLNAVSLPGIGKWLSSWAPRFKGRRVTVCLDCDEACCPIARAGGGIVEGESRCGACGNPKRRSYGGRDHAHRIVGDLLKAGVLAVPVDLFPGRDDGYDLSDALAGASREGRVDELRRYLMRLESEAWSVAA